MNSPLVCLLCLMVIFAVWGCYATAVIPFIRRSQGCTLGFRPFPTLRRFASRKSTRSKNFSPTIKALWSVHPHKCLIFKNHRAICRKSAFSKADFTIAAFRDTLWFCDRTPPRKRLGSKVKFRSTQGGKVILCTLLSPLPEWTLTVLHCPDQPMAQRGDATGDKQRTQFEYSAGFSVSTCEHDSPKCYRKRRDPSNSTTIRSQKN